MRAPSWQGGPPACREGRHVVVDQVGKPRVICMDPASMVEPEDAGQIVITGSHGAMLASMPELVLQVDALIALFNDAGIGIDEAGVTRLRALARRGIACGHGRRDDRADRRWPVHLPGRRAVPGQQGRAPTRRTPGHARAGFRRGGRLRITPVVSNGRTTPRPPEPVALPAMGHLV